MTVTAHSEMLNDFPSAFKGPLVRPDGAEYDEVRRLWNIRGLDRRPALIARASDADDVLVAVRYAIDKDISIAVRGGGHGIECHAMPEDALVVDLSLMKAITVDTETGRTTVQPGVIQGELNAETQKYGYAVPAGTVSEVGISGFTLGGGVGHLTRRFGATVDNLISVDVVTMDGRSITASAGEYPELFWGLRGAGQNLAIATSFTFQAHRVGPDVISGFMLFGPDDVVTVLAGLDDAMAHSPRELSLSPIIRPAPAFPGVPEELIGKPVILAAVVFTGPPKDFEVAMTAVRTLPAPLMDLVGPTTWLVTTSAIDFWMPSGRRWHNNGGYLPSVPSELAQIIAECIAAAPADCEMHLPIMAGGLHDFAENSTAFSRSGVNWMYELTAQWDSSDDDEEYMAWIEESAARLAPFALANGYINLNPYVDQAALARLYGSPEKWQRILALKREWDPTNRLRHNKNIVPELAR